MSPLAPRRLAVAPPDSTAGAASPAAVLGQTKSSRGLLAEAERERDRCIDLYVYIYILIYISESLYVIIYNHIQL